LLSCVETFLQIQAFFDDRHEQIDGNGDTDLGLHSIHGITVEELDAQVPA
jgi:hypothetical protein